MDSEKKKGARISDHLRKLDEMTDQLAANGEELKDVHKVAVLLRSVQEAYRTLVTALLARGDDDISIVLIQQNLLNEEKRRGKNRTVSSRTQHRSDDSTLKASQSSFSKGRKPGKCYSCEKSGHFVVIAQPNQ